MRRHPRPPTRNRLHTLPAFTARRVVGTAAQWSGSACARDATVLAACRHVLGRPGHIGKEHRADEGAAPPLRSSGAAVGGAHRGSTGPFAAGGRRRQAGLPEIGQRRGGGSRPLRAQSMAFCQEDRGRRHPYRRCCWQKACRPRKQAGEGLEGQLRLPSSTSRRPRHCQVSPGPCLPSCRRILLGWRAKLRRDDRRQA